jgi:SAM-dependent methyltransferase
MTSPLYFMESEEETARLDIKTDVAAVLAQAVWAGLHPGMSVADVGCGPGKTSAALLDAVRPGGRVVGIDGSAERLEFARQNYGTDDLTFHQFNALDNLDELGTFDFVWCRFLLEYHRERADRLYANLDRLVRPGGILCLIDLDYNCMTHFGLPARLETTIHRIIRSLERDSDFDPFAGRRIYTKLFDMGYTELDVQVSAHHLIFGALQDNERHNWEQKLRTVGRQTEGLLSGYPGGYEEFAEEFQVFFEDARRFTYTPLILCRGRKPLV